MKKRCREECGTDNGIKVMLETNILTYTADAGVLTW
jgi:hypothetical protein